MTFFSFPVRRLSPHPALLSTLVLAGTVPRQREGEGASREVAGPSTASTSSRQAEGPALPSFPDWPVFLPGPGAAGVLKGRPCS